MTTLLNRAWILRVLEACHYLNSSISSKIQMVWNWRYAWRKEICKVNNKKQHWKMRKSKENEERKNLKKNTRGKRIGNKREKKKMDERLCKNQVAALTKNEKKDKIKYGRKLRIKTRLFCWCKISQCHNVREIFEVSEVCLGFYSILNLTAEFLFSGLKKKKKKKFRTY